MAKNGKNAETASGSPESAPDSGSNDMHAGPSWGPGLKGALYGVLLCGCGVVALSLATPLPENLPGVGSVRVVDNSSTRAVSLVPDASDAEDSATPANDAVSTPPDSEGEPTGDSDPVADVDRDTAVTTSAASASSDSNEPSASDGSDEVPRSAVSATESESDADTTGETPNDETPNDDTTDVALTEDSEAASQETEAATGPDQPLAVVDTGTDAATSTDPATDVGTAEIDVQPANDPAQSASDTQTSTETQGQDTNIAVNEEVPEGAEVADPSSEEPSPTEGETTTEATELAALAPSAESTPPKPVNLSLGGPALSINARPYDAPPEAPLMAVVLADAAKGVLSIDALPLLTMPLTFSITPNSPADRDFALAARSANHEVLGLIPVQQSENGSGAGQILTSMAPERIAIETTSRMALMDMAVGATTPDGAVGAADPLLMDVMLNTINQHGFAYVDTRSGIGSVARRISEQGGVAYVHADRFVPAGATSDQIFQMLETTAYRARREGTSILVIGTSQEALQALLRWGLERDRRPVWFAPISAVIAKRTSP